MSQGSTITRKELPENVTLETFNNFFNDFKTKVENNSGAATAALNNLETNWNTISHFN